MAVQEFISPTSLSEAQQAVSDGAVSSWLAGGTDLLVGIRLGARDPARVIDLKQIPELTAIEIDDASVRIGAAASAFDVLHHSDVPSPFPGLAEAPNLIRSTQITGRCSAGGNPCPGDCNIHFRTGRKPQISVSSARLGPRQDELNQQLARRQCVLIGSNHKSLDRQYALALGPENAALRAIGNERRNTVGRGGGIAEVASRRTAPGYLSRPDQIKRLCKPRKQSWHIRVMKDINSRCRSADPHRGIVNFDRRQLGNLLEINNSSWVACTQPDADQEIGTAGQP